MEIDTPNRRDEAEIRKLIGDEANAICAKDVNRIMAHYVTDVIIFNVKPFQIRGADAFRQVWETSLAYFPASFETERRDLRIFVRGDLAIAHWFARFTGMGADHPARSWLRNTVGDKRNGGKWQIVHGHCSIPFDPETSKAVFNLEP